MPSEVKLPELGENLEGGDVLDIRVAPGDQVREGQPLVEIEAEKSTVEVPSPLAGRVAKVLVKKGDTVQVGQTFCLIEGQAGEKDGVKTAPVGESKSAEAEPEPKDAARQEGTNEPAETAGDTEEEPGVTPAPSSTRQEKDGRQAKTDGRSPAPRTEARPKTNDQIVPGGPATRRLARELGVDLTQVSGSAPGGRVTREDVKDYVRSLSSSKTGALTGPARQAAAPLPDFEHWGPVERRPQDAVRRKTAEHMSLAWSLIPHVTQHDHSDITELEAFRKQHEGQGPKLTATAFALKAAAAALKQFPQFNASLDMAAGQLVVKQYIHIGVAVDTERGLLVPVIRDVDKKGVSDLARELAEVAEKARQKKLQLDEMRGGTFTITNLGGIGGTAFTPIINYPEVAILGMSRASLQPVIREGQVTPRLILPLSLSYDHRVIDGASAARFTRRIAEMLENPLLMLL
jgi:pyruvate dehydrogenase E2 component (dihydrolipoamide acetyltransferase)